MTGRMLIDATHPEETRVVVLNDRQLEDFDFESSTKKQLKGNIYLAKITRVEPSLQAAFVDYGGNRHGFLAFSEIHPDYFQIPQADRELLEEQSKVEAVKAAAETDAPENGAGSALQRAAVDGGADGGGGAETVATDAEEEAAEDFDEQARRRSRLLRSYKIQEVIKRRQIMLVQVVKEERGAKGAALTTYLSLAGRYGVLMPNTPRGGGISRKIADPGDRKRLKAVVSELQVPEGMGLIVRTAGQERSKAEIRRDYEYLLRLWNDIRETTLSSVAPCLIYEEANLIKRAVRDLYARDLDEVLVEGDEGYRTARRVMSMLMPSRARRVKQYRDGVPLFYRYKVEDQLDAMHSPVVQLRSGGSIVIHTTEALTAIDVNSGRSTRERHIEETALKTNLEAADEIARQLRLRDLAGLVVIDFIDMAEGRNQRAVERRMREALKADRARVQLGRISAFGLLELSRQRLRPSFQELSSQPCSHCGGTGVIRSTESSALKALRVIEEEGIERRAAAIVLGLPTAVGLYLLNQKRDALVNLETRYGMRVTIRLDDGLSPPHFHLERTEPREAAAEERPATATPAAPPAEARPAAEAEEEEEPVAAAAPNGRDRQQHEREREETAEAAEARKRRRRRRRKKRPAEGEPEIATEAAAGAGTGEADGGEWPEEAAPAGGEPEPVAEGAGLEGALPPVPADLVEAVAAEPAAAAEEQGQEAEGERAAEAEPEAKPKRRRRRRSTAARGAAAAEAEPEATEEAAALAPAVASAIGEQPATPSASDEAVSAPWSGFEAAPDPLDRAADEAPAATAEEPVSEPAPAVAETQAPEELPEAAAPAAEAAPVAAGEAPAAEPEAVVAEERRGEPEGEVPVPAQATREEQRRPEAPASEAESATDADEEEKPEMPAGALVDDDGHQGEARRGWWSRWVRKDS